MIAWLDYQVEEIVHMNLYFKGKYKLKPLAYTYDWGFWWSQARMNISKICGLLNGTYRQVWLNQKNQIFNLFKC